MRLFVLKSLLLAAIVSAFVLLGSGLPGWRYHFGNGETESNLYVLPKGAHFDMLIFGTSHGRIFSRSGNHARVEQALGQTFLNLSKGGGRGVMIARLYLEYFLRRGNRAETIVYFIDPWALYSSKWNEDNDLFSDEPLDPNFISFIVGRPGMTAKTWINYVKSKTTIAWLTQRPSSQALVTMRLSDADPETVDANIRKRVDALYPDGLNQRTFDRYAADLRAMAKTAHDKRMRMIFIIPTTQLGDLPGEDVLKAELDALHEEFGAETYDHSDIIADRALYYDTDHLNAEGILEYTQTVLKPIAEASSK